MQLLDRFVSLRILVKDEDEGRRDAALLGGFVACRLMRQQDSRCGQPAVLSSTQTALMETVIVLKK